MTGMFDVIPILSTWKRQKQKQSHLIMIYLPSLILIFNNV
jgi:hypothetical protein